MLTKNDLQQIRTLFQDETRKVVREETTSIVQGETRKIIREETRSIVNEEIAPLKRDILLLKKGQSSMKRQLTRLAKDVKYIAADSDTRIVENKRDIQKLKHFVGYAE